MALAMLATMAMASAAWAGNNSVTAKYWRVTNTTDYYSPECALIEREFRLNCGHGDIYVSLFPDDPAWSEVKKVQPGDWLWLNTGPGNRAEIVFGLTPPGQTELGNILD